MKTVFNNSEICHVFAERTQTHGRTSSNNIYFENDNIYSYGRHYLLAQFINDKTIVINNTGYSSSTGKHINYITQATRQYQQYFFNDICLNNVHDAIKTAAEKLINARKKEFYVSTIIQKFESFENFLRTFKKCFIKSYSGYIFREIEIIKKDEKFQEIKKIYKAIKKDENKYIEAGKERIKKEIEKKKQKLNDDLKKFFAYELDYINSGDIKEDYIRISKDKTQIETTQRIKIDISEAVKLYKLIKLNKDIHGYRISSYTVISLNGVLKVGCHNINTKNMSEIGEQILKF